MLSRTFATLRTSAEMAVPAHGDIRFALSGCHPVHAFLEVNPTEYSGMHRLAECRNYAFPESLVAITPGTVVFSRDIQTEKGRGSKGSLGPNNSILGCYY